MLAINQRVKPGALSTSWSNWSLDLMVPLASIDLIRICCGWDFSQKIILEESTLLIQIYPKNPSPPPMETPDPPNDTPGASKQVVLTPHDIPRILRVWSFWEENLPFQKTKTSPGDSIRDPFHPQTSWVGHVKNNLWVRVTFSLTIPERSRKRRITWVTLFGWSHIYHDFPVRWLLVLCKI